MSDAAPTLPAQPSGAWKCIFVGPNGARAGWRLLMFIALSTALWAATTPLQRWLQNYLSHFVSPWDINDVVLRPLIVLFAVWVMGRCEHRSLADYGFPIHLMLGSQFWTGALWNLVCYSFVFAEMAALHVYSPGTLALLPAQIVTFGLVWAVVHLAGALMSELLFGYIQFTLTTGMGFWPAAALTICSFIGPLALKSREHGWVLGGALTTFFLCLALRRTGNLWFNIGWVTVSNWSSNFLFSLPSRNGAGYYYGHLLNASVKKLSWLEHLMEIAMVGAILLLAGIFPEAKFPRPPSRTPAARDIKAIAATISDAPGTNLG